MHSPDRLQHADPSGDGRLSVWVLPLVGLALVAPRAGIGGRFVHYVVASNWASAIIAWLMLPAALIRLFLPSTNEFAVLAVAGFCSRFRWS